MTAAPYAEGSESLTPHDDAFHPASDDAWWTETVWFSWRVEERGLLGYVYPVFRPNLGIQFGGVVVFGEEEVAPYEEPVFDYDWHRPMPPDLDLRDFRLESGLSLRVLEPMRRWQIGYSGRDLTLDLEATAVNRALVTRRSTPPLGGGHVDQLCRVRGSMHLHGEQLDVDCLAIRDRAWNVRRDGRQPRVFYSYGAVTEGHSFLAAGVHKDGVDRVTTGWYERDGQWSRIVSGQRLVTRRPDGQVAQVTIDARDAAERHLLTSGTAASRHLYQGYPAMICWTGLVAWRLDGAAACGEDQDVWSPRGWRNHRAAWRTGDAPAT